MYLEKAIFVNCAPFNRLELDFKENEIAVLSAVNGGGKTTILSYIVDAFYEIAKSFFPSDFRGKEHALYRISSGIYRMNISAPSFVYIRFRVGEEIVDYLDVVGHCSENEYNEAVQLTGKIPFSSFSDDLRSYGCVKTGSGLDQKKCEIVFSSNVLTYFPSYRCEQPGYLGDPYKINLDFKKDTDFDGKLKNKIEVISILPDVMNWVMDIFLDACMRDKLAESATSKEVLISTFLQKIITKTMMSKTSKPIVFSFGDRHHGARRLLVQEKDGDSYGSTFSMSSGEAAIFCLFAEIIRQGDKLKLHPQIPDIRGIVLIDEIDKHLHIKLQKEVLPELLNLFPNIQFIVTSHSPFLGMGFADQSNGRARLIDLDSGGISRGFTENELYTEVYDMMVGENERFKEMYESLEQKVKEGDKPLVVTEGKTDVQHLERARERLGITDCDVEFFECGNDWGHTELQNMLRYLSKVPQQRKVIGIFDRDVSNVITEVEEGGQEYKDYGNNVCAFCIPTPDHREEGENISIEFYYSDQNIKKEKDGKCLYFDNELNFDSKRKPISIMEEPKDNSEKKIWDGDIGNLSGIHSKSAFARFVATNDDFISDFDFTPF